MQSLLAIYRSSSTKPSKQLVEERDGLLQLSMRHKREVLLKCIYGVDIDPQAVEVAQLSLYLKLLEDETTYSARHQQIEMGAALLPSLNQNVVKETHSSQSMRKVISFYPKARRIKVTGFPEDL